MPDVTDIEKRKGKPASDDPCIRAAETIVYQSKFPPHAFKREGNETVARFTKIIRTAVDEHLKDTERSRFVAESFYGMSLEEWRRAVDATMTASGRDRRVPK